MRRFAPPTRREISLLLFCLTIFTLAYNLDNSFRFLGFDTSATQGAVWSRLGFGTAALLRDGRRPIGWRNTLEDTIFGGWAWKDGQVAGQQDEVGQEKGIGPHSSMWMSRKEMQATWSFGQGPSVGDGFRKWRDDVPTTKLVLHRPGLTILDQAILFNGTIYIVTDAPGDFPSVNSIAYPRNTGDKWAVISTQDAKSILGDHGGIIYGVSWMSPDPVPHNSTLFELWSLHSQQKERDASWPSYPQRLFLPQTPVFSDPDPDRNLITEYWLPRPRSDTGFHPYTLKTAFPSLTVLYKDDWNDYNEMEVPFVIEHLAVIDREVSSSLNLSPEILPEHWWEPIRRTMALFFDSYEPLAPVKKRWAWSQKKTITYIHRQDAPHADPTQGRLSDDSHEVLVHALGKFAKGYSVRLNIVSSLDGDAVEGSKWAERMKAVVKSDVVLGVHGPHLLDAAFMKPSPESAVLEFFSPGTASRERESIVNALGMKYVALWSDRTLSSDDIAYSPPPEGSETPVNADAVIKQLRTILNV
ncbi:hypothetical protein D9758_004059 [Tetrapyrgos nigripes]|uniref:Uncharacterized protein n=1 Tax=Tetrapyrgos nigripes TaxID=182062 RepID=A0A8H5LRS8_9AGAR|nr:hypothetical protein D9758_004059 [Tetrapyrgos nigripes]